MTYVTGFVTPVKTVDRERYIASAKAAAPLFKEYGALTQVEAWGDKVPDGTLTDFKRAVKAEADETVVLSWVTWPDKATADAFETKMMSDPRFSELDMPFDGKRMIYAGFETIFEA